MPETLDRKIRDEIVTVTVGMIVSYLVLLFIMQLRDPCSPLRVKIAEGYDSLTMTTLERIRRARMENQAVHVLRRELEAGSAILEDDANDSDGQ